VQDLLTKVVPLALGAAVSPTVLGLELLILSSPKRPVARGAAYVAGTLVVLSGLTVVGLAVTNHGTGLGTSANPVTRAIDGTLGFLLLLLALHTGLKAITTERDRPDDTAATAGSARFAAPQAAFVLGIVMMLSNFSTILLYLPAMRAVTASPAPRTDQVVAVVLAFVITAAPIIAPLLVRVVAPGPSAGWFASLHRLVTRYQTQLAVGIEVVFGVYLLVKAVRG
jgi:hypothetical protein